MNAAILETTTSQRLAADPALSAFVSANAGAGKTRVLTNRVARLLLADGVDPSTILCITFTKAAAAEMADRLFRLLGDWALAPDEKLQAALADLDGDARMRDAGELARARRLFARALETPGGLKIQTIHSFCESVLKRFPLEAGVAPGFSVIEELEARDLRRRSVDLIAEEAGGPVAAAFARLLSKMQGDALRALLDGAMGARRDFARGEALGFDALSRDVSGLLGVSGEGSPIAAIVTRIEAFDLARLKSLLAAGSATTKEAALSVDAFAAASGIAAKFAAIKPVFLTGADAPRKNVLAAAVIKENPAFAHSVDALQAEIVGALDSIRAAAAAAESHDFFTLLAPCFAAYDAMKAARAALDFDDLIAATGRLLASKNGASWVLYKLDMGLSHILLDEAQDTGPDAWRVIEAPLQEFFSGESARPLSRTFFAVGDQKQSIYSFQGADAALFNQKEKDLGKKIAAVQAYENVPLLASFRSALPVLDFADALFARDEVIENVSVDRPLRHRCTRDGAGGLVELWPLAPRTPLKKPDPWDVPLDATTHDSPPKLLAAEVAKTIAAWLRDKELLASQGRPIEPGDILILVQNRGALFTETIRALGAAGVPVAGADKVRLIEEQGVLDLLSYARAALFDGDDLSLAETLRSPFFNVTEESLYALAAGRETARLWPALAARRAERPEWAGAFDEISRARVVAAKEGAAAFFSHLLETGAPSGWRRIAERLGTPAREPIEAFLRQADDFERSHPRSLRLFLDAIVRSSAEISRDYSEAGASVRVMTAHKAKGLEANIVFLIDAHRRALTGKVGAVLDAPGPDGAVVPVLALDEARKHPLLDAAHGRMKRLIRDEYRRLLYVAATRARDRLYICGHALGNDKTPDAHPPAEKSWHALAEDAFDALGVDAIGAEVRFGAPVRRLSTPQTAAIKDKAAPSPAPVNAPFPDYLHEAAPVEPTLRRLAPSRSGEERAYSPRGADPYRRGRILHRLLELLPRVAPDRRLAAADRILASSAEAFSAEIRAAMRAEAMRVLEDPAFAAAFAPGSLAEVAISGRPAGATGVTISGQIDRLAVTAKQILVIDFKTNRPPPKAIEDVAPAYIAQLAAYRALLRAIYPGRAILSALLWTFDARLMAVPDEMLDHAALTLA